eukprot:2123807-Rhodomonas_salina.1
MDVHNNQLSMLHPEFGFLRSMENMDLDQNPLTSPPLDVLDQGTETILDYLRRLFESRRTCRLELNGYKLTALPIEVCNLTHLTDLQLANNSIRELPIDIMKLDRLVELNMEDN